MAVLAAVLAHAGRIVGDAARIGLRVLVERRLEQQHPVRALDPLQAALDRGKSARVVAGAGIGRPAGGHGVAQVDLASVVGEVEQVMIAAPADLERLALTGERRLAPGGESFVALRARDDRMKPSSTLARKKPIQTLVPIVAPAEHVDAVVPVAGAQERQAVRAQMLEGEGDGEARMLVDGRAFARDARNDDPGLFVRRHGLGFEERRRSRRARSDRRFRARSGPERRAARDADRSPWSAGRDRCRRQARDATT